MGDTEQTQPPSPYASDCLYYMTFKLSCLVGIKPKNAKQHREVDILMGQVISVHIPLQELGPSAR